VVGVGLGRFIGSLLFEVKPYDFTSMVLPSLCLLLACTLAAWRPAMRATRVDPMTALRHE
jgi:ABC-type antimicrobial peptide transport system permease subunit